MDPHGAATERGEGGARGPFLEKLRVSRLLRSHLLGVGHVATSSCKGGGKQRLRWVVLFPAHT